MSLNSSTNTSDPLPPPHPPSDNSSLDMDSCFSRQISLIIYLTASNMLFIIPLCVAVLCHGLRRWRRHRSSAAAQMTHSDSFTYHMVVMEIISVSGSVLCCGGLYMADIYMLVAWSCLFYFTWYGQTFFHIFTCVEHYVAIVHPIVYLRLKKQRARSIRDVMTGCTWLLCCGAAFLQADGTMPFYVDFCLLIFFLIVTSFCCLSVLYVLLRPGPGDQGRERERIDQSKLKAFYTILAILGVMLLRCVWYLFWLVQSLSHNASVNPCVQIIWDGWVNVPSSLVLPLLFLQRAGKLVCGKNRRK